MGWNLPTLAQLASGKFLTTTVMLKIKECLEYLYGQGSLLRGSVPNGNFEIDSDSDGIPDGWTQSLYAGGAGAFDETTPMEGIRSWQFTHPGGVGNGGGSLTSDYIECSPTITYCLRALHYTSVTGVKDLIQVQYYDKDKVVNGAAVDLYNSSACAASPEHISRPFTPTALSQYLKVKIIGGHTDESTAGDSFFDDVDIIRQIVGAALPNASAINNACAALVIDYPTLDSTGSASWVTLHSWEINRSGSYRITFTLTAIFSSPGTAYGRIYKNGVAFGTLRSVYAGSFDVSATYSEALTFVAGDVVEFKAYVNGDLASGISGLLFYANDHTFASQIS